MECRAGEGVAQAAVFAEELMVDDRGVRFAVQSVEINYVRTVGHTHPLTGRSWSVCVPLVRGFDVVGYPVIHTPLDFDSHPARLREFVASNTPPE